MKRDNYRLGVAKPGTYELVFSSEAEEFGGSGPNHSTVKSEKISWHGQPHSLEISVPPLSISIWKKLGRTVKRQQTELLSSNSTTEVPKKRKTTQRRKTT
ncbi:1,4-alpha-glucan branching enzyme GlgB [compost metagenome]